MPADRLGPGCSVASSMGLGSSRRRLDGLCRETRQTQSWVIVGHPGRNRGGGKGFGLQNDNFGVKLGSMTQMPADLATIFRENVRRALDAKHWNQRDLARALGISDARVSQFLHDSAPVTTDLAERIAAALEIAHFSLFIPVTAEALAENPKICT